MIPPLPTVSSGMRWAGWLAASFLFASARDRWAENQKNFSLPLSKIQKLQIGLYLVLRDYSRGLFPPRYESCDATFENERKQYEVRPGIELEESANQIRKTPFWLHPHGLGFLASYLVVLRKVLILGIRENDRVLELGCGSAAMSEFLATSGAHCVASSISDFEITHARNRAEVLELRRVGGKLSFAVSPMEEIAEAFQPEEKFRLVFVHAALHHAFSWRAAAESVLRVLEPGGWFLICNEPSLLHSAVSYRVALLDHTHEVGLSRREIVRHLSSHGYEDVHIFHNRWRGVFGTIWIAAQKPVVANSGRESTR